jgi:hypothetical protein
MADESELRNLELRIARLEDQLKQERAARQAPEASDEELKGFLSARRMLHQVCADKKCAFVQINVHCCSPDDVRSLGRFLGLTGTAPDQETPSEPA